MNDRAQLLPRRRWVVAPYATFAEFAGIPRAQSRALLRSLSRRSGASLYWFPVLWVVGVPVIWMFALGGIVGAVEGTPWDFVAALSAAGTPGIVALLVMGPGAMIFGTAASAGLLANLCLRRRVLLCLAKPECIACGYDLAGLPASSGPVCCPECGVPAPTGDPGAT